ncbi:MAG: hypothetical protein LBG97_02660 [Coriobacteriales bacterium]|nr:hypothetical protein [Coriobacteriales bacterium]
MLRKTIPSENEFASVRGHRCGRENASQATTAAVTVATAKAAKAAKAQCDTNQ